MDVKLTIEVNYEDGKYSGRIVEMPGCFGAGRTFDELMESLTESVAMCAADYPDIFGSQTPDLHPGLLLKDMQAKMHVAV